MDLTRGRDTSSNQIVKCQPIVVTVKSQIGVGSSELIRPSVLQFKFDRIRDCLIWIYQSYFLGYSGGKTVPQKSLDNVTFVTKKRD
jgi:hypothetical protein